MVKFNSGAIFALTVCFGFAFAAATTATANPQPQAQGVQAQVQVETRSTQAYSPTAGTGGHHHGRGLDLYGDGIHHNLRSNQGHQHQGIASASAHAQMPKKGSSSDDGNCEEPEVYCGMTVHAGETLKLKHDLYCTKDSADGGDEAVAITLEPGAKIECNGYSVVQVRHLSWGRVGIKLESGATAEHCKATGWVHGFSMVATTDDQEIQNTIVGCDASLNTYGVGIDFNPPVDDQLYVPYFLNFSIEQSSFSNNYAGLNVVSPESDITSKIYFKDVKFNSNAGVAGLRLPLSGHSEVTMENVEASYNVGDTPDPNPYVAYGALFLFTAIPGPEDHVARVIFKGKNSFNNNAGTGLELQMYQVDSYGVDSEIVVSKKSQLNVDENGYNGLSLVQFGEGLTTKFLVEKGGAVNACGNLPERLDFGSPVELYDIKASGGNEVEWIGHFNCDRENNGPDCIPCPSCD